MQEGIEKGEKRNKVETAKKMKEENLLIELIINITGLTKEEIEKM